MELIGELVDVYRVRHRLIMPVVLPLGHRRRRAEQRPHRELPRRTRFTMRAVVPRKRRRRRLCRMVHYLLLLLMLVMVVMVMMVMVVLVSLTLIESGDLGRLLGVAAPALRLMQLSVGGLVAAEVASTAFHEVVLRAAARQALALAGTGCGCKVVGHVIAVLVGGVAGALAWAATSAHFQHHKLLLWKLLGLW